VAYNFNQSELTTVHHVGVAVKDINKTIERLEKYGLICLDNPRLPGWLEKMFFNGKTFDKEYKLFGKGPFYHPSLHKVLEIGPTDLDPSLAPVDGIMRYNGKPFTATYKIFKAKFAGKIIELFEPVSGDTPWGDYMDKYGEGLHHVAFEVDRLDKEIARLVELGAKVVVSGRLKNGGGGDYLDFGHGMIIEVFKYYY
jgi:hypothetical protein